MNIKHKLTLQSSPIFSSGFRPFFLVAAVYSMCLIIGLLIINNTSGKPWSITLEIWILHEVLFGVALTMLVGFFLTAFPAWTRSSQINSIQLRKLTFYWFLARLSMGTVIVDTILPLTLFNLYFYFSFVRYLVPNIRSVQFKRHRIFFAQLILYFIVMIVIYWFWFNGNEQQVISILHTGMGVLLIIFITILSRISMVVVNNALSRYGIRTKFVAKPPKRNFAIGVILSFLIVNLFLPHSSTAGWLALASAASVLQILSDWHLPKAWRDIYFQVGYSTYVLIAVGFILIGTNSIWSDSYHPLSMLEVFIGPISVAMILIMLVVGQKHTGHFLQYSLCIRSILLLIPSCSCLIVYTQVKLPTTFTLPIELVISMNVLVTLLIYIWMSWKTHSQPRVDGK